MARYKVEFSGFAYVEADSKEEAQELFENDDCIYSERDIDGIVTIKEFGVEG